jgi:hypothetical protein
MQLAPIRHRLLCTAGLLAAATLALVAAGCASPGPPRPPSLQLPLPVKNLTAERTGDTVTLRFTVPQRTTDNLPIKTPSVGLHVCRAVDQAPCVPVASVAAIVPVKDAQGGPFAMVVRDRLPAGLTAVNGGGLLTYTVEMLNARGRSAGPSNAAYSVAGPAPAPVGTLTASGTRLGVVLAWTPAPPDGSEVVLRRESLDTKAGKEALLRANPDGASLPNPAAHSTLDTTVADGVPYRYTAQRQHKVTVAGHMVMLRGEPSAAVDFTLRDTFPPPVPTDLQAAGFEATPGHFAVDLIWQAVDDPGLTGYLVYRVSLGADGKPDSGSVRLTAKPVSLPAYQDTTASADGHYRWSVTAVDRDGNESVPATVDSR